MNSFRTEVIVPEVKDKIQLNHKLLLAGSCFTENIGRRLRKYKFNLHLTPGGIIYNPISLVNILGRALEGNEFSTEELMEHNQQWLSLSHHGSFSFPEKEACLQEINNDLAATTSFIKNGDFLFVTLGTAWIYNYLKTGQTVANCHKIPSSEFSKRLLKVNEVVEVFVRFFEKLFVQNEGIKIVFTISPVRHWADGAVENQRSKSVLHVVVNELQVKFPQIQYFPAYEVMMDDLRDYRFYNSDMLHPSTVAIDYIWEKFSAAFIDEKAQELMLQIDKLESAMNHRPFNPASEAHQKFRKQQLELARQLAAQYPDKDFSREIDFFRD